MPISGPKVDCIVGRRIKETLKCADMTSAYFQDFDRPMLLKPLPDGLYGALDGGAPVARAPVYGARSAGR
eukprot:7179057-Pyramimonas_sp.AAC.1